MNVWRTLMAVHLVVLSISLLAARPAHKGKGKKRKPKLKKLKNQLVKLLKRIDKETSLSLIIAQIRDEDPKTNRDSLIGTKVDQKQSECRKAEDGEVLSPCPTPGKDGIYTCIDGYKLCDGTRHCPNGEDENATMCLFHNVTRKNIQRAMRQMTELSKIVRETS